MVASRYRAELKTGVTSEIFGHGFVLGLELAADWEEGVLVTGKSVPRR